MDNKELLKSIYNHQEYCSVMIKGYYYDNRNNDKQQIEINKDLEDIEFELFLFKKKLHRLQKKVYNS